MSAAQTMSPSEIASALHSDEEQWKKRAARFVRIASFAKDGQTKTKLGHKRKRPKFYARVSASGSASASIQPTEPPKLAIIKLDDVPVRPSKMTAHQLAAHTLTVPLKQREVLAVAVRKSVDDFLPWVQACVQALAENPPPEARRELDGLLRDAEAVLRASLLLLAMYGDTYGVPDLLLREADDALFDVAGDQVLEEHAELFRRLACS